uniref:Zinc finger protein 624-like n=1 Tax=Poecilia formosa TaxID=48698 RepID=A0A096LV73_POEFO
MEGGSSELPGPTLPLSALRLLVSPIRLVSAAIWHTVEQKIVSDYGLLEEFVFMVTEIVPQLLSTRQRAELILGLRARLILELCRSDETADLQIIQPHLDRMQSLRSLWKIESTEVSDSHFMGLVQNLLRDPDERMTFFQDVFPGDFGPTYDKAIQTLMWLFLSRLEKLLPAQSLQQQVVSLMSDTTSFLNESMETLVQPEDLKVLLDTQKNLTHLEDIESYVVDSGILSALCLPPVERVVIVNEQPGTDAESSLVYTVCSEMEVESENKEVYVEVPGSTAECAEPQWFGISGEVKTEMDSIVVSDPTEGTEASEGEMVDDRHDDHAGTLIIGEDGQVTLLDGVEKKPKRHGGRRCDECDKAFKYKSTLDSHKQTHNPLYCEVCMKLVRDSEALAMHKESHTPFQCNRCEEHFPVFKALHKHYIDAHNPTEPFTCPYCETTFSSLKRFIRHEWKHTGYQPFQCTHCAKRFRSYSDLVEHQKKHTKAYPYLCWECGKKFRHGVTLTRHVERVHHAGEPVDEKPTTIFPCTQCDKTFTSRRCLLKHDNFHHKGMRFPCEHCGKGFFGKDALVRHTLIHTGERPFKCDDCEKSFRSAAELKIHRRYHTGERPFKCTICEKGFVQSCFLTLHMRTHTGERPYVCAVCNKGF